jgi:hypothetical protein
LAAAVIAPARIALGVFVGERRPCGVENRTADNVFGRDQLDLEALPLDLPVDRRGDVRVRLVETEREEAGSFG